MFVGVVALCYQQSATTPTNIFRVFWLGEMMERVNCLAFVSLSKRDKNKEYTNIPSMQINYN